MTKGWFLIKILGKYNINYSKMTMVYWIRPYCTIMTAISSVPFGTVIPDGQKCLEIGIGLDA